MLLISPKFQVRFRSTDLILLCLTCIAFFTRSSTTKKIKICFIIILARWRIALELNRNSTEERLYGSTFNPTSQHTSKHQNPVPTSPNLHTGLRFRKKQPCRHHCREEDVLEFYLTTWEPEFSASASFPTGAGGCQNQPETSWACGFNGNENIPLVQVCPTNAREQLLSREALIQVQQRDLSHNLFP